MAASKSQKIQAEIDKVKAKISEQQARLKELEQKHREAENEEIVDIVRGMSVSLEELPWYSSGSGTAAPLDKVSRSRSLRKRRKIEYETMEVFDGGALRRRSFYADLASRPMPMRTAARARTTAIPP